ncbi:unnamed protein product [Brassica oleracea var. botrytis]
MTNQSFFSNKDAEEQKKKGRSKRLTLNHTSMAPRKLEKYNKKKRRKEKCCDN